MTFYPLTTEPSTGDGISGYVDKKDGQDRQVDIQPVIQSQ